MNSTITADPIKRSWRRCHEELGLTRTSHSKFSDASRRTTDNAQQLLPISAPELARLTQVVGKSGHSIILTDQNGTVLSTRTHRSFQSDFDSAGLVAGQCWGEAFRGTNGIGTCLVEQTPTLVHGDQHFVSAHQNLSCAAAPIFDERHNLLAVLDTSTVNPTQDKSRAIHTLAMVTQAAKRIERAWFTSAHAHQWMLEIQHPSFGVLLYALDDHQTIESVNLQGNLARYTHSDWVGQPLSEVIDSASFENLWDTAESDLTFQIPILSEGEFLGFGHMIQPSKNSLEHAVVAAPRAPDQLDQQHFGDPKMERAVNQARRLIDRGISVLISGETGVGKDRFAKAMHEVSSRRDGPMVTVNCAAIAPELLEAELFGYAPGAFTGANPNGHKGFFQQANHGTLFLDEIGDMPLAAQAKLLRVVEEKTVTPVGSSLSQTLDIAIISASHVDLEASVRGGLFRQDLLYRLRGIELALPALRHRADKAALLKSIVDHHNAHDIQISKPAMSQLTEYSWPGNCRQAVQVISTSLALADADSIVQPGYWLGLEPAQKPSTARYRAQMCDEALATCNGNVTQAAQHLGIGRATFYRWREQS